MNITKRVVVIGLDAWPAPLVERLLKEGALPNLARLCEKGSYGRSSPFWPCATGNNWASIITGASPDIHHCDFTVIMAGSRLDESKLGFSSVFCKAEQLWQAASRAGLKSIVIDYPQSYPVNANGVTHIGEDGCPDNSLREVFFPWGYATSPAHRRWHEVMSKITLETPRGWKGLPRSPENYREAVIELKPGVRSKRPATDRFHLLLEKSTSGLYDTASLFGAEKDYTKSLGKAKEGEWTSWAVAPVRTTRGPVECAFRAKILKLDPSGQDVHMYLSQGYPTKGFTNSPELSEALYKRCGPYHHHGHTQEWVFFGACDIETMMEEMEDHARWFREASVYSLANCEWDLFVMKWHDTDTFQHSAFHMIDPIHPLFDPAKEKLGWEYFRRVFGWGDQLIGSIEKQVGEEAVIAVVSDHGQIANTYFPDINSAFAREGLFVAKANGSVDPERTKLYVTTTGIVINRKGKYKDGIVDEDEARLLTKKALEILQGMKHPHTGDPAFQMVATTEDAAFMGLGGPQMGDIVFMLNPVAPNRKYTEEEYEDMVMSGMWLTSRGTHGSHLPSQTFGLGGIEGIAVLAGPGVKHGRREHPYWTSAVAPTLSRLSGLPMPRNANGAVIYEALEQ